MKSCIRHTGLTILMMVSAFLLPLAIRAQESGGSPVAEDGPKVFMHYRVVDGDTVFVETIRPSWVWSWDKSDKKNWRRYYRLVHNFSKTYPYAKIARKLVQQTDSTFDADNMNKMKKEKYVNRLQDELFHAFEKPMRSMTISQGQLLIKLVDREVGKSSYDIIRYYKNGIAAKFWQGIAKMFKSDLKKNYDPKGADKDVEELIQIWERGDFPFLYYSIFGEYPKVPVIPSKYR